MTTVLEIITDALQDAGIISSNETPNATDGQKAFRLLNRMLDADSTESLMIYSQIPLVFPLTNKQTYTIGPGGDFSTARPVNVISIYMRDTNGNDLPCEMLSQQEYADILSKPVTSSIALSAWYNAGMPLSEIWLYPVPSSTTYSIVIWVWDTLTSFTAISDSVILPPGYEEYIETNLAVRCCIAFNRPLPPELVAWAKDAKDKIKIINYSVPILTLPASLAGGQNDNTFPISPHILTGS